MHKLDKYPFLLRRLTEKEGGGYFIEYPGLPGCMSEGKTMEEAHADARDAVKCWLAAAKESGRAIPEPGDLSSHSGKWVQRVPRSMHLRLVKQAEQEGVSLNTLVVSMILEGL